MKNSVRSLVLQTQKNTFKDWDNQFDPFGENNRQFGNVNVAHVFEVTGLHVDAIIDVFERCNNGKCIMTRPPENNLQLRYDGLTDFNETTDGWVYDIRLASNPR